MSILSFYEAFSGGGGECISTMLHEKLPHLFFNIFYILKYDLFWVYFIFRFLLDFQNLNGNSDGISSLFH